MQNAIETRDLVRRFAGRTVVDGVCLQVPEQSIYGFVGRNGAGKTTTLKMLLGVLRPDAGGVFIGGIDAISERIRSARLLGSLLEAQGFYGNLSGRENLDLGRRLLGCRPSEISRVLEVTDMTGHADRRVADYSLGMRQRLGIARAMLGAPPILILDEPTNGLDPEGIADMRRLLRTLPQLTGATVLISSHLLAEIDQVASHVGMLSEGKLVMQGALAQLKAGLAPDIVIEAGDPAQAAAIAGAHGFSTELADSGLVVHLHPGDKPRECCAVLASLLCAHGVSLFSMAPRAQSLETLYHRGSSPAHH